VVESIMLKSNILKKDMSLSVYLPPQYDAQNGAYAVLYLLHGMGQNYKDWVKNGGAKYTTDSLIAKGLVPNMIIVMPDAGNTFFVNSADGYNYEDYFFKELIPYIDSTYKTRPSRSFRAIAGLSMGGYGATLYSLKHQDMFSACAGFSSAVVTDEEVMSIPNDVWDANYAPLFGKAQGKDRLQLENWRTNNTLSLFQQGKRKDLASTKWYFDIGDDDSLYKGNSTLHIALSDKGIPHEFRMRDGAHTWDYWRTGLGDALIFIGKAFK
jgi:enterochelin esterase-like enzyme